MSEFTNFLSLLGIIFEMAGFIIIMPQIRRYLDKKITQNVTDKITGMDKLREQYKGKELEKRDFSSYLYSRFESDIEKSIKTRTESKWSKLENIAIPFIIAGLFLQAISLFL
ncbi:MAG: hypothetical protein KC444_09775 [Nitrosopumilus sp.]|nr:hypothetical protein [Nitrosopumilus sp.]